LDNFQSLLTDINTWMLISSIVILIAYRRLDDWLMRFVLAIFMATIALSLFASAEVVLLFAQYKNKIYEISHTINIVKFAASVLIGATSVGLILHSVTFKNNG